MGVTYPPIGSSQIFAEVKGQSQEACRKIALITDLGNDIMYGVQAEKIIAEIRAILERLENMHADAAGGEAAAAVRHLQMADDDDYAPLNFDQEVEIEDGVEFDHDVMQRPPFMSIRGRFPRQAIDNFRRPQNTASTPLNTLPPQ